MRRTTFVIAMATALLTSGCTAGDGGAEPISDMGPEQTAAAGEAITSAAHSDARNYRLATDGVAFAGGCKSTLPVSPADADNDNLPDESTVITYTNCVEGGITFSGQQAISDDNIAAAGFQFTSTWDITASGTIGAGTVSYTYEAAIVATGTTAGTFQLTDAASIAMDLSGASANGSIADDHAWDVSFTPDDGVLLPAPGLPLEAGDLTLSGAIDSTATMDGDGTVAIGGVVSTAATLRTDPACATSIVSGQIQVLVADPEPGTLLVTWSACGATDAAFTPLSGT